MGVKIVFGIMSAVAKQSVIEQLVDSLGGHQVVIHHDFSQQPDFKIVRPNVQFIPNPSRTGWGTWGHTQGVYKMLDFAIQKIEFDYFQLLSPSCLPIKPIAEFERSIAGNQFDANTVFMDVQANRQEFMHYAYRVYAAKDSLRYRALRRIRGWYFGDHDEVEDRANLQIQTGYDGMESGRPTLPARIALGVSRLAQKGWLGANPFGADFRPMMGDMWFGARPQVAKYLLGRFRDPRISDYFSRLEIAEELLTASILGNSGFRIGPANHFVNTFIASHPKWLDESDLDRLAASPRFFGRKFVNDPDAPVRRRILERVSSSVSTVG
jgi:hypothetical protein